MKIKGNLIDIFSKNIYSSEIEIIEGKIASIQKIEEESDNYILPGLIDSHIHIESSMLSPVEFSKQAIKHGTVGIITDPHEIANVCGLEGIHFMIENSKKTPLKIFFGAPSCVPATSFETAGSIIDADMVNNLLDYNEVFVLSEMMNFPGVIYGDAEVHRKLKFAQNHNKPIDGHAPGISGLNLKTYIESGISTDHECFSIKEARQKISLGMKVLIREGSAAKNFDTLFPLIDEFPDDIMFCCDDKHPDELVLHHIDNIIKRAISKGADIFNVLKAVSINPVEHYKLPVGLLRINDPADFIVIDNINSFNVLSTFIDGKEVYNSEDGINLDFISNDFSTINNFYATSINEDLIKTPIPSNSNFFYVIEAIDGELITNTLKYSIESESLENVLKKNEINKIVLINRYSEESKPVIGFIKGFNLDGAIASTIAHDSHNIIAVGNNDTDLTEAINQVIETRGGLSFSRNKQKMDIALEIGGIMTNRSAEEIAAEYNQIEKLVKDSGCNLKAPFMTLSFMALLVIPNLKISDRGLFDITKLSYVPLFE
jgi:adenine deaminase